MSDDMHRKFTEKVLDSAPKKFTAPDPRAVQIRARIIRGELRELDELLEQIEFDGILPAGETISLIKESCDVTIAIKALFHGMGLNMDPFTLLVINNNLERLASAGMGPAGNYLHSPEEKARFLKKVSCEIVQELIRQTTERGK